MCGLVGYAGLGGAKQDLVFKDMLNFDVVRGADSTGVGFVSGGGDIKVVKNVCLPPDLIASQAFEKAIAGFNMVLMGHNRFATKGHITKDNAHPFLVGNVLGCHNGTIRGQWRLPDHQQFQNDSHNIMHAIDKIGIEQTWENLEGAAALVYWDRRDASLNMIRNTERPLFYMIPEEGQNGLYWASEEWMIMVARARHDLKFYKAHEVSRNKLMKFRFKKGTYKIVKEEIELRPFVYQTHSYQGQGRVFGGGVKSTTTSPPAHSHGVGLRVYGDKSGSSGPVENLIDRTERLMREAQERIDSKKAEEANAQTPLSNAARKRLSKLAKRARRREKLLAQGWKEGPGGELISEQVFNKRYDRCFFCESHLVFQDNGVSIIDSSHASCSDCSDTAEREGMRAVA